MARAAARSPQRRKFGGWRIVTVGALLSLFPPIEGRAAAEPADQPPTAEQAKFFELSVRPVLAEHCYKCHGPDKQTSDLRLDSRAAVLAGGESGPAIVPGEPDESLLIEAINHESFEMPPSGMLEDQQIANLTNWVRMGAPWPGDRGSPAAAAKAEKITDEDRRYWFFQPLTDPAAPEVADAGWSRTPIDPFIFRRLQQEGLSPAVEADPAILVRRVYFDLTGLPPTPAEIDEYLADQGSDRYERLIDRLLANPRYGERWARFWLDLVRYAESDGWRQDAFRSDAYKYRDYVIRSFNDDKPYDRFVREQLAGDEIAPGDPDALTATMYLRHGIYEYNQRDVRTQWENILNEITDTTGDVFLGLGMGCARCHDHKFDPILKQDYYRLRAYFTPLLWRDDQPLATVEQRTAYDTRQAEWERQTADIRRELDAIQWPALLKSAGGQGFSKFPPDIQAMMLKLPAQRTPYEHQLATLAMRQLTFDRKKLPERIKGEQKARWEKLRAELAKFDELKPEPLKTVAFAVSDAGPEPPPTVIPGKPNAEDVLPGILTILDPQPAAIPRVAGLPSTGRRAALARWLTDPENPLTTRVIVNRIWQYHFGRGIVATSSDFGRLGEPPSHPELLDWLARRFVQQGWSFKQLHRLIVTSAVYRQSAWHPDAAAAHQIDPENRLLWRMNTRRLDAEQIRDSLLAIAGELDLKMGGGSVAGSTPRRSIYTKVIRNTRDPLLAAFDMSDRFASSSERNVTTTPTQALLMINGPFGLARAKALARRLRGPEHADDTQRVAAAYRLAFGRQPSEEETHAAVEFLSADSDLQESPPPADPHRLVVASVPHAGGEAVVLKPDSSQRRLALDAADRLPQTDFTIEAVVLLNSLYADATVRTIAAHWDSATQHPGWSLGVTSEKSHYTPRNLILQLVGKTADGKIAYEVIPSNIHLELNTPYYVAAAVKIDDTSQAGVTFYVQNLAVANVPEQTAQAAHQVVGEYRPDVALTIGGRDRTDRHYWDGLVGEVRLTAARLDRDQLLIHSDQPPAATVGHWKFEPEPGMLADSSGNDLTLVPADAQPELPSDPRTAALIDFCHALLNANEFIYVD